MKSLIILAMVTMISACGFSMDTFKYANGTTKIIQAAPCEITITEPPTPAVVKKATKINIMEPVLFNWDKSDIRPDQQPVIDKVAALMAEYPDTVLLIDAYASVEGATDYNLGLSQRRADSTKAALIEKGVAADRIKNVVGKGETDQFAKDLWPNRRAIILSVN